MDDNKPSWVKAALASGQIVKIILDFDKLDDQAIELILARLIEGPYVCRGKYFFSTKSVTPRVEKGKPQVLDVHEATTESLIDALYRDQLEVNHAKRIWREIQEESQHRTRYNLHGRDWS